MVEKLSGDGWIRPDAAVQCGVLVTAYQQLSPRCEEYGTWKGLVHLTTDARVGRLRVSFHQPQYSRHIPDVVACYHCADSNADIGVRTQARQCFRNICEMTSASSAAIHRFARPIERQRQAIKAAALRFRQIPAQLRDGDLQAEIAGKEDQQTNFRPNRRIAAGEHDSLDATIGHPTDDSERRRRVDRRPKILRPPAVAAVMPAIVCQMELDRVNSVGNGTATTRSVEKPPQRRGR